jgi:hypothetical protein
VTSLRKKVYDHQFYKPELSDSIFVEFLKKLTSKRWFIYIQFFFSPTNFQEAKKIENCIVSKNLMHNMWLHTKYHNKATSLLSTNRDRNSL